MWRTKWTVIAACVTILLGAPVVLSGIAHSGVLTCQLPKASAQDNPCLAQEATISALKSALLQATLDHLSAQATITALQTTSGSEVGGGTATVVPLSGLTATRPASVAQLDAAKSVWEFVGFVDLDNPGARAYQAKIPASINKLRFEFRQCVPTQSGFRKLTELLMFTFRIDGTDLPDSQVLMYDYTQIGPYPYCRRWGTLLTGMQSGLKSTLEMRYTWNDTLALKAFVIPAGDYNHTVNITFQ
ncbi:MAG: hypothetical protein IT324_10655 [Anaerolineae bacterium]|nr:hypothetical protein [Anaerolineae bacterium]